MDLLSLPIWERESLKGPPRIFLPAEAFSDREVQLTVSQQHYLRKVLRKQAGDKAVFLDGQGKSWACQLHGEVARRVEDWPAVPPTTPEIVVGLALCKGSRFEGAVEKLAELGVATLLPLLTKRTQTKAPSASKLERWRQIALSSSALAGRLIPLSVEDPRPLSDLTTDGAIFCHPDGDRPEQVFGDSSESLTLVVGPEGGFSPAEVARMTRRLRLGALNLRVETAAVCAVSQALALSQ